MSEIYRRPGTDKWQARCRYAENGRLRTARRSTGVVDDGTAKSRRTAQVIARDIEQSLALGAGRKARPVTLAQALRRMILDMERAQRAQDTIDIVHEKSEHLFAFFGPQRPADAITGDDLKHYADWALDVRKASTVEREIRTLRQAIKAAGLPAPPKPDLGSTDAEPQRPLSPAEQQALLMATPNHRRDYVLVYLRTGVRDSELYRLGPVDWDAGQVFVDGTKTKGSKRWIPMSAEVRATLWDRREVPGFFEPWGNAWRDLNRYAARAGIVDAKKPEDAISLNDLRGTFATAMAPHINAIPLAKAMGTSPAMLHKVYAALRVQDVATALEQLPALPCAHIVSGILGAVDTADGDEA